MNLAERHLSRTETVEVRTGPHPITMTKPFVIAALFLSIAIACAYRASIGTAAFSQLLLLTSLTMAMAGSVVCVWAMIRRASVSVVVTGKRVIEVRGIVAQTTREMRLDAIQTVDVRQPLLGRIFNYGTVTLESGNDRPMVLKTIAFPLELQQALQDDRTRRDEAVAAR